MLRQARVYSAVANPGSRLCVINGFSNGLALSSKACLPKAQRTEPPISLQCLHPSARCQRGFQSSTQSHAGLISYNLADIGEGITECEIIQWFVKVGDKVSQFDKICEVASDKATVEITSRYDGTIRKLHYNDNEIALVGKPLVDIELEDGKADPAASGLTCDTALEESVSSAPAPADVPAADRSDSDYSRSRTSDVVYATPAVRRVAREHLIDLRFVPGSGKDGRILKEDVYRYIKDNVNPSEASISHPSPTEPLSSSSDSAEQHFVQANASESSATACLAGTSTVVTGEDRVVPLLPIQRAMFKSMTESLGIPHFRFKDEIELDALMKARRCINDYHSKTGSADSEAAKMSFMPFFMKAASLALAKYPILNAKVVSDDKSQPKLLYRAAHNIGVAMDTPGGLIVPNVKNVQTKTLIEIAAEIQRLVELGKRGAISSADMKGGTFTLSNVGMIGGTYLSPVLVSSEVCIGAIGKTQRLPRFETTIVNGNPVEQVVPRHILVTSWSADHRVVDGATMARFATLYKQLIEYPELMLANMK
ncbi:hypothetical protein GGH99_004341 [Coemansia sp. RSA 1285]|nr:hypothetical protein GGH99_004341 [Coemansia sp. RSA 1285]